MIKEKNKAVERENLWRALRKYRGIIIQLIIVIIALIVIIACVILVNKNKDQDDLNSIREICTSVMCTAAGSIVVAGISIFECILTKQDNNEVEDIKSQLGDIEKCLNQVACDTCGARGVKLYKNRNEIEFGPKIQCSKRRIWIYMTNLNFLTTYFSELINKSNQDVSVRVLGLKPTNLFISTRYHELNHPSPDAFFQEICASIGYLQTELRNSAPSKDFEVRLYASQPTHMMFLFDDCLIISFILRQGRAREQIHIEFDLNNAAVKEKASSFITDFEQTWNETSFVMSNDGSMKLPMRYDVDSMEAQTENGATAKYKKLM